MISRPHQRGGALIMALLFFLEFSCGQKVIYIFTYICGYLLTNQSSFWCRCSSTFRALSFNLFFFSSSRCSDYASHSIGWFAPFVRSESFYSFKLLFIIHSCPSRHFNDMVVVGRGNFKMYHVSDGAFAFFEFIFYYLLLKFNNFWWITQLPRGGRFYYMVCAFCIIGCPVVFNLTVSYWGNYVRF